MDITSDLEQAFDEDIKRSRTDHRCAVRKGMEFKAASGGKNGLAPLGYVNRQSGHNKWVEVDSENAPYVREAFRLAREECLSVRQVLDRMTDSGMRSRRGKKMGPSSMLKILTNLFYEGYVWSGGKLIRGSHEPIVGRTGN